MENKEGTHMNILSRRLKGQTMVLVIAAIPALIAALALCTDVLVMYFNWEILQKAADASVLAGAGKLPDAGTANVGDTTGTTAQATAKQYLPLNGSSTSELVGNVIIGSDPNNGAANRTVSLTLKRNVAYNFGQVVGLSSQDVQVTATALLTNVSGVGGPHLVPLGYGPCPSPPCGLKVGQNVSMPGEAKSPPGQIKLSPGNWGGLTFPNQNDNGNKQFTDALESGYPGGVIMTGTTSGVTTNTGSYINPSTQTALGVRYGDGTQGTTAPFNPDDSRVIVIPLVDSWPNGNSVVNITGFLTLLIVPDGFGGYQGLVLDLELPDSIANPNGPSTGAFKVVLIK